MCPPSMVPLATEHTALAESRRSPPFVAIAIAYLAPVAGDSTLLSRRWKALLLTRKSPTDSLSRRGNVAQAAGGERTRNAIWGRQRDGDGWPKSRKLLSGSGPQSLTHKPEKVPDEGLVFPGSGEGVLQQEPTGGFYYMKGVRPQPSSAARRSTHTHQSTLVNGFESLLIYLPPRSIAV